MKVFISESSRRTAHNLDDLSERWEIRKEKSHHSGFEVEIPSKLPDFATMADATKYRADLVFFRERLYYERKDVYGYKNLDIYKAISEISRLQLLLKAKIQELHVTNSKGATEEEKVIRQQIRAIGRLISGGSLLVHENEGEIILVFPTVQQTIVIKKGA